MKNNIFIPKKIKVGFNKRGDTYTGKLGYVIYHDGKVWRKEKSWEGWRETYVEAAILETMKKKQWDDILIRAKNNWDGMVRQLEKDPKYYNKPIIDGGYNLYLKSQKADNYTTFQGNYGRECNDPSIKPVEYNNTPIEGFVLNRKAGGNTRGHSWNQRQTYCRVYDPRGFEFEITISNLLYILENASSTVGKGLEGKFIYGWEGKDLVLIPEAAPEYKDMVKFTELQGEKISKKDLIPGHSYLTFQATEVIYLGEFPYYDYEGRDLGKQLWFYILGERCSNITTLSVPSIKQKIGELVDSYSDLMVILEKNINYKPKEVLKISYVLMTEEDLRESARATSYYDQTIEVFILEKKFYKKRYLTVPYRTNGNYAIRKARRGKETSIYTGVKYLLSKIQLYKEITNKKDGKEKQ